MKLRFPVILIALFSLISSLAGAAESGAPSSAANAGGAREGTPTLTNKKFKENEEITDPRLKAAAGSLSRYSMHFNLFYNGPPLGDLGALEQPNPDGLVGRTATAITGVASLRYRLNPDSAMSLNTGLSYQHPFRTEQLLDVNNPGISYDHTFKLGSVQMLSSPGFMVATSKVYRKVSESGGLSYRISAVQPIGTSRFSAGLDSRLELFFFERGYRRNDGKVRQGSVSLDPSLKYRFTDHLELSSGVGLMWYRPRRSTGKPASLDRRLITERLGLAYAFSRDLYLQPYLQFFPGRFTWRDTTVNVASIVSLF